MLQGSDFTVVCRTLNIIVNYFMVCTYFWVLCEGELRGGHRGRDTTSTLHVYVVDYRKGLPCMMSAKLFGFSPSPFACPHWYGFL